MRHSTGDNCMAVLSAQLRYIDIALKANTEGITEEDSLAQPPHGGNCLNWVLGHVVATRNRILELVGQPPIWSDEKHERYRRHSLPIVGPGPGVISVREILADFDESQESLLNAFEDLSNEDLEARVSWFGEDVGIDVALAGLIFHEAYHIGQTGLMRRLVGKNGAIE